MTRARSRFPVARAGGQRRQTTWIGPPDQNFVAVGSGASVIIASFNPSTSFILGSTVVRSRGAFTYRPDSSAADVDIVGAFGMGIVSEQALAAGAASVPGAFDEADWDGWFVWRSFAMSFESVTQASTLIWSETLEIDSKAMRKVHDNEAVVQVVESNIGAIDVFTGVRMLLKLP